MTTETVSGSEPADDRMWMIHFFDHKTMSRRYMLFSTEQKFLDWVNANYGSSEEWGAEVYRLSMDNPDFDSEEFNRAIAERQLAMIPAEGSA